MNSVAVYFGKGARALCLPGGRGCISAISWGYSSIGCTSAEVPIIGSVTGGDEVEGTGVEQLFLFECPFPFLGGDNGKILLAIGV